MEKKLGVAYRGGTHRLMPPARTLKQITPMLKACGITRCADVTYLDNIGISVFCAIRPPAAILQVSNGKGLTPEEARVSALMEAIELFHAENPESGQLTKASIRGYQKHSRRYIPPDALSDFQKQNYFSIDLQMEWVEGEDLQSGDLVQVPASFVFFSREPALHITTTNGLASGNHIIEASLHGLYELIERDAAARLLNNKKIPIREKCRVVDLSSIEDANLQDILEKIRTAGSKIVVLHVESCIPVHTFWAVLLNKSSAISGSTFNTGWGTHLDLSVAASRAITEAVQSRATMIHGSREDAIVKPVFRSGDAARKSKAFQYFDQLEGDISWHTLRQFNIEAKDNLTDNFDYLLAQLAKTGHPSPVRCDLVKQSIGIPVVKMIAPSLSFQYR